jgi:hypothetical protein
VRGEKREERREREMLNGGASSGRKYNGHNIQILFFFNFFY